MLYIAITMTIAYVSLEVMNKFEEKEELKKAEEEGYEVFVSRY